ncbi:MAG TPA: carboxypeptidase-like regulatory domain-containing protein, partial [Chitinophagaceae bacterium]|nr:carboxypeptidase-like regulatory domain-containing protein [Chitinophagaceae bacterium]
MTKLTVLFLLLGFMQVSATSRAQSTISVHFEKTKIAKALRHLEKESKYIFYYNNNTLEDLPRINLEIKDGQLSEVLDSISKALNINFTILDNNLIVVNKPNESLFVQDVSGQIVDAEGNPLVGVTIKVKGTNTGTVTDVDGNYSLEGVPEDATLVVSYVGFETKEVPLNGKNELNITLTPGSKNLDELVVVGYGTQKKKEITSAIANVDAKDFNKGGVTSPMDLIQGKVAGLTVTNASRGNPNASASIQLRGITSITGDLAPLIVINGIPGGNLDMIQQDDIKSISVLKDGSAAAIYGTRANGGVILVTTKKGKSGAPKFEYSTYFKHADVAKRPNNLSASEYRNLMDKGIVPESNDYGATTDLYDSLLNKNNLTQYHYFSATGGSKNTNYRASLYYSDKQGIAKQNSREEFGGRININQTGLQDRLTIQMNLAANVNNANLLGGSDADFEQAVQWNPTAPIHDPDGYGGF